MLLKSLTLPLLAVALAATPPQTARADTKDLIIGAIVGGAVIAGANALQKRKQREAEAQRRASQALTPRVSTRSTAHKTYRAPRKAHVPRKPSIPATQEGREIQSALNYFGFNAGTVDGRVGRQTKTAVSAFQAYMGYPASGTLSAYEQHLLTQTYLRAQAGGTDSFAQIARMADGPRGLLLLYRQELAASITRPQRPPAAPSYLPALDL